jgi:hypothetical protein
MSALPLYRKILRVSHCGRLLPKRNLYQPDAMKLALSIIGAHALYVAICYLVRLFCMGY